ncbi:proteoglycan 4b isoform X2 [Pleuronectes platessa]|uniref:proteoglycan 4b isoform X2 n=1 Tax=Pleuronectes platessa TaxID=8262 RepID=UPI00232A5564|nr:proteoglycan 4b isoform X2 [Pleuronectes platessa]
MSSTLLCAGILLACAVTLSAAQTSCKGRCGAEYYRGYMCQCDYTCLLYGECCDDYESQCTTKSSCKGRCGESFKRGRRCTCDPDCFKFKQCCPDYKSHCDAEEEISGAAGATAPVKTSSCDSVNNNKPTEPPLLGPEEQPSTFSEENKADEDSTPLVGLTSYLPDDSSDDTNNQLPPDWEFTNTGQEETSPVPEGTSGYGSSTADPLDHVSTEPTLQPDTEDFTPETVTVISQTEATQTDDEPTVSSDPGTTLAQATTEQVPDQPTPTSAAQTEVSSTASSPEPETAGQGTVQPEDDFSPATQTTDLPEASTDNPEVTTLPFTTAASASTGLTQDDTTADASQFTTLELTTIPDETTSNTDPLNTESNSEDSTTGLQDPSTSVSPELDAPTTHVPSSTSEAQDETTDEVPPQVATADPVKVTDLTERPQPTKPSEQPQPSTPIEGTQPSKPTEQTSPSKPTEQTSPSKPTEQTSPSKPTEQTSPSKPTEQTSPSKPSEQTQPSKPTEQTSPSKPTEQTSPSKPTEQTSPSKPTEQTSPSKPTEQTSPSPTEQTQPSKPTERPQIKPSPLPAKPILVKDPPKGPGTRPVAVEQALNIYNPRDYQADDSNDTNLCSGRPVGAVTTLRNGTVVVFRGHYFWLLNRHREPGPARGITQVWGVPSPIDTVFTRCSCHGKTYMFKGSQYWRFDNDALDSGYPKVINTGFDGLRGHITAALSVPQYNRRRESVYFFKRGGQVQKYSYQFGTSPSCGRKVQYPVVHNVHHRIVRQAVSALGPVINIRTSWRGFPTTVTAAVSVPSTREPEGYKYYVFSRSKSYSVRLDGDRPVMAAAAAGASPQSSNFIKCPRT